MISDGLEIRLLGDDDGRRLAEFFDRVPEGDRTFFKEDVLSPGVVERWGVDTSTRRFVTEADDAIVGYLAVEPGVGWSAHVGELRIVVDPARRRRGVGRALARRGLLEALELGLRKVVVECVADQDSTIGLFTDVGFRGEALLEDHVRDRNGVYRDLIVLAHNVDTNRAAFETVGLTEELG